MRYDALSCNGAPVCKTPNLDALAREGTRFTCAYTSNALCSPSRASILTGLYPHNHGQLANIQNSNSVFEQGMLNHATYFSLLKSKGYQTGYIGKWHLEKDGMGILGVSTGGILVEISIGNCWNKESTMISVSAKFSLWNGGRPTFCDLRFFSWATLPIRCLRPI